MLSTRIDILYGAYGLNRTTDEESVAEREEVDEQTEEIAELEETTAPATPPPPGFNPGTDKPTGISPTESFFSDIRLEIYKKNQRQISEKCCLHKPVRNGAGLWANVWAGSFGCK